MKKISKKGKRVIIISLIVLLLVALGLGGYFVYKIFDDNKVVETKKVDELKDYGYYLEEDSTDLYKKLFNELKIVLSKKDVDMDKYAELVSSMFVVDYYNLDNKVSKDDVGGTQFVLEAYKENFILESSDTVYKYVEQNVYKDRKQKLPIVTDVKVSDSSNYSYSFKDLEDSNAYDIKLNVTYKEDLGYPTEVEVKLIHNGKKLEVFYMN